MLQLTPQSVKNFRFNWADVTGAMEYRLLENPDGVSGYTQIATVAADAVEYRHMVFLPERVNARYILQACNFLGCTDSTPLNVSGTLTQAVGYVKAHNTVTGDNFGNSVALSEDGSTLAVGAYQEAAGSGAIYIFTRSGVNWSQQDYLKASNPNAGDLFGWSVTLSSDGNTLATGATLEASNATGVNNDEANNSAGGSGAVYVFARSGVTWSQQAYIKASNTDAGDRFGYSISLSGNGNTLAVGAYLEDSDSVLINGAQGNSAAADSGAAYVFTRSGVTWSQQAYIKASNTDAGDLFGYSLALSDDGNTLAAAARDESTASGAAYIYVRSGADWSLQAYLKASNTQAGDQFGHTLALAADGNTLAVSAIKEGSNAIGIDGDGTNNGALESGAVYVFTRSGITWDQQAYIKASNTAAGDLFGYSVSLDSTGNRLAVSAVAEDSISTGVNGDQTDGPVEGVGAAYVFTRNAGIWQQLAYIKASNPDGFDNYGISLTLSGDGGTLAVASPQEDSNATGINGDQTDDTFGESGAVYLY